MDGEPEGGRRTLDAAVVLAQGCEESLYRLGFGPTDLDLQRRALLRKGTGSLDALLDR